MPVVTRFAPSPTGHLHLGHAHSALFAARAALDAGSRFLVRIEDIDGGRCRPEFETSILDDLAWLGLEWEKPVRRQSDHMADYAGALSELDAEGLIYPCFCTRKDIADEIAAAGGAPQGPDGPVYPGICRNLSPDARREKLDAGAQHALRLDVDRASVRVGKLTWRDLDQGDVVATPEIFGDVVLARKDTPTSYHLAVTTDDALQGVTLVTRGEDLRDATHIHRLLQALLDLPTPDYKFHRLLTDADGKRLAKRDKAATLKSLRDAGRTPAEVRALAGWPDR